MSQQNLEVVRRCMELWPEGKGRGSGVETEMRIFQVWTLRAGRIVSVVGGYRDRTTALEDAGLDK
jgi:hypothetical protein